MRYANYKLTGVRKFPSIPAEWDVRRVKNFAVISHGSDPKTEGDIPVYGSGDSAFKSCGEFKVGPVVLIGRKGATLHIPHYVEGKYWNVDTAFDVRVVSGNDLRWFYYLAQCFDYALYVSQTTLPSMTQSNYNNMRVPYPPLPTQRAIVAYLDEKCGKVDRLVAAKENEVALLKELKQSMIAEAVTGATKVARTDTARKMKPSGISWLPEVPEGWEVRRLKSLFSLRHESYSSNEQLMVLSLIKDVGVIPYDEKGSVGNKSKEDVSGYNVARKGDIVMNSMNVIIGSVDITPFDGYISPAYYALTARDGVDPKFFNYLFHLRSVQKTMRSLAKGILEIRLRISTTSLLGMAYPVPPLAEQREIVAHIEARAAKIDAAVKGLEREVAALKEYKQRLIADVVTGQRKVA